jgi:glycosyltransferase involved in cell wall biosynthesis
MHILYLTYDGLTDPIGGSQILPYLAGSTGAGRRFTAISFEKRDLFQRYGQSYSDQGIEWRPYSFHRFPPYASKAFDQWTFRSAALAAAANRNIRLVHARSYPAAMAGLAVKRRRGIPMIFDMRGLWPDQRREGGRWRDDHPVGRWLYKRWKRHEATLVGASDHLVVLTRAAAREIEGWPSYRGQEVSVIPCCADFELFRPPGEFERSESRRRLGFPPDAPVLAYLGSFGTVYLTDEHFRLFDAIRERLSGARMLVIGAETVEGLSRRARHAGVILSPDEVRCVRAEREEVPGLLASADVATCFILPSYSSLGVSPTKLAEYLACGVPVIANDGVGDVPETIRALAAGHIMSDFSPASLAVAADAFSRLLKADRGSIRRRARLKLDLPLGIDAYDRIYRRFDPGLEAMP